MTFSLKYCNASELSDAVIKIFVTYNEKDFFRPWQSKGISTSMGSGCIINNNQILTNAHVVTDNTFIQVKKRNDPKKYTAEVIAIAHDCDLALLKVNDKEFFEGIEPLQFGELPDIQDEITVIGYPKGGGKLSITKGIISRVELVPYAQSSRNLMAVQIDAAINNGNSGGAVIKDNKLVGISMQTLMSGQNIGYMIPTPVINHFFEDLQDSNYDGFPILGFEFATTENDAVRDFYKINNFEGGVLVTKVYPFSPAFNKIKENDIILKINNTEIGEDGTFNYNDTERLLFSQLIAQKQINDNISLEIVRNGKLHTINFNLSNFKHLVAYPHYYKNPTYFIYGGLVFSVLSSDLIMSWGENWWRDAPLDFTYYLFGTGRLNNDNNNDLVVLLQVLSDDINKGYHELNNEIITGINGKKFTSFYEFIELLTELKEKQNNYLIFETNKNNKIIINNTNIDAIDDAIIKRNTIPSKYSDDIKKMFKERENK